MKQYVIEVTKNKWGNWFWRIKAGNNRILAHSEEYSSMGKALKTACSVSKSQVKVVERG